MDFVRHLLLFLHLLGLASLLGGFLTQLRSQERRMVPAMLHGGLTQLVSGLLLVAVDEEQDYDLNTPKVLVKLLLLLVVLGVIWTNRTKQAISEATYYTIGVTTLVIVAVSVFWT